MVAVCLRRARKRMSVLMFIQVYRIPPTISVQMFKEPVTHHPLIQFSVLAYPPQPEFCTLTHLVKVDLSKNQLVSLPEEIGQLCSLQHLDLYNNKLTMLPLSLCQLRVSVRVRYIEGAS